MELHFNNWVIILKSKREEGIPGKGKSLRKTKHDVHICQWKDQPAPEERLTAGYLGKKI